MHIDSEDKSTYGLNYCWVEPKLWATSLFTMLLTCFTIEQLFFSDYETRLKLDNELVTMRSNFERFKEQLRRELIARYQIDPPAPNSVIVKP